MSRNVDLAVATRSQDVTSEREARTRDVKVTSVLKVESLKGDLAETKRSLAADETLADKLAQNWDNQSSEWDERWRSRAEDLLAINETIKLLNDDDALELLQTTRTNPSSVQVHRSATEYEAKVLAHQVSGHRDAIADYKDQLSNTDARIERIAGEITDVPTPQRNC